MVDLTCEQLVEICGDTCPSCKAGAPLRRREDTGEYVHDFVIGTTGFSHSFCLASYLRNKYKDVLDG